LICIGPASLLKRKRAAEKPLAQNGGSQVLFFYDATGQRIKDQRLSVGATLEIKHVHSRAGDAKKNLIKGRDTLLTEILRFFQRQRDGSIVAL
jgi:hypothetical protein